MATIELREKRCYRKAQTRFIHDHSARKCLFQYDTCQINYFIAFGPQYVLVSTLFEIARMRVKCFYFFKKNAFLLFAFQRRNLFARSFEIKEIEALEKHTVSIDQCRYRALTMSFGTILSAQKCSAAKAFPLQSTYVSLQLPCKLHIV